MTQCQDLLDNNQRWSADRTAEDNEFFTRLADSQSPEFLWIGCADSRVSATQVTGLKPGDIFVHRNIANVVPDGDVSSRAVIQYAVDALKVRHIIVCGHYGCGGVKAALDAELDGPLDRWIEHLRGVRDVNRTELDGLADDDARWTRLCELNVQQQVRNVAALDTVRGAWQRNQPLSIHGWIYGLGDGLLKDLGFEISAPD